MQTLAQILAGIPADPYQMNQGIAPLLQQQMLAQAQGGGMPQMSPGMAEGEGPPVRGFMQGQNPMGRRGGPYAEGDMIPQPNPARDAAFGAELGPTTDSLLGNGRDEALLRALMARRSGYGI